jgi:xeroderma pigmentosum group C-complementing protein
VKVAGEEKWVHVDIQNQLIDSPESVETILRNKTPVSYVLAIGMQSSSSPVVDDVTAVYAMRWSLTEKLRLSSSTDLIWWRSILNPNERNEVAAERARLQGPVLEAMPRSLAAFKSHSVYVLPSQLGPNSCIIPERKRHFVGLFNGECFYRRSDVSALKSASAWKKEGRQVKDGERAFSKMTVHLRNGIQNSIEVYGDWQTTKIAPKIVNDGIIPSNEHGNIEIWGGNEQLVPVGTILIRKDYKQVVKVAESFGVQYREALFGFEEKAGRKFPVIGGVVILESDSDIIFSAIAELDAQMESRSAAKKEADVLARWCRVVRLAITRCKLKDRHGA